MIRIKEWLGLNNRRVDAGDLFNNFSDMLSSVADGKRTAAEYLSDQYSESKTGTRTGSS